MYMYMHGFAIERTTDNFFIAWLAAKATLALLTAIRARLTPAGGVE
jgi:hypothetical protein